VGKVDQKPDKATEFMLDLQLWELDGKTAQFLARNSVMFQNNGIEGLPS
jgi:hypothetical protein